MVKHWKSCIYKFNKNIQLFPVKNKIVTKLVKNYMNFMFRLHSHKVKGIKFMLRWQRGLHNSRPIIKHSNNKTIIIIFVYNTRKILLLKRFFTPVPYGVRRMIGPFSLSNISEIKWKKRKIRWYLNSWKRKFFNRKFVFIKRKFIHRKGTFFHIKGKYIFRKVKIFNKKGKIFNKKGKFIYKGTFLYRKK